MTEDANNYYTYDGENRVKTVVSKATSQTIASYAYDYMGRRTSATDQSGDTTYFHYDGWNVVAESDGLGTITARYYYDTNGQIMAMKRNGNTYYYQFNAHGDVVSLTDSSGNEVNTYEYDPWGNHLSISETVEQPFRYVGYRFDEDTGLYYLRARYYSSEDFRFLTRDPDMGSRMLPVTINPYVYGIDNPLLYVDPSGRSVWGMLREGAALAGAGVLTYSSVGVAMGLAPLAPAILGVAVAAVVINVAYHSYRAVQRYRRKHDGLSAVGAATELYAEGRYFGPMGLARETADTILSCYGRPDRATPR